LGSAVGPAAGGLAANLIGLRAIFLAGGTLLLLAAIPVLFVVRESPRRMERTAAPRTTEVLRQARAGTIGALAVLIVAQGLQQTSYGAAQQLVVLRLLDLTGAKEAQALTGLTFAAAGIATALASLTYHRLLRRTSYRRLITAGALLLGLALLGAAAAVTPPLVIAAFVIASFFSGALIPAFGAMTGLEAPVIVQATVFGVGSSAIALGFGLGPLLGGIVASAAGIRAGLIVAAALALILAALVGFRAREPRAHQPI
jgi:DHA1 family multidrug resistance protein-like MFS transporter